MYHRKVIVFDNTKGIVDFLLERWLKMAENAIRQKGFFSAALSGGRTPSDFYRALADTKAAPQWQRTHIFMVDERFVPVTDQDSNFRMLKSALLDRIDLPADHVHPILTDTAGPSISADIYERELRTFFRLEPGRFPVFDLVMLGLGADGHTASLFPGSNALKETQRLTSPVFLVSAAHDRITITLPVINNAAGVFFLITGGGKARVFKDIVENSSSTLPATLVRPSGNLLFVADREAGALLSKGVYSTG